MKQAGPLIRVLMAMFFIASLAAPFATVGVNALDSDQQEIDPTGILEVVLVGSDTGERLAGACWDVVDANQSRTQYCDFDGDGVTSFELAPGVATVTQSGGPDGYVANATGTQSVVAGSISALTLYNAPAAVVSLAQEPEENTAEATETETTTSTDDSREDESDQADAESTATQATDESSDAPGADDTDAPEADVDETTTDETNESADDATEGETSESTGDDVVDAEAGSSDENTEDAEKDATEADIEASEDAAAESGVDDKTADQPMLSSALAGSQDSFSLSAVEDLFTITCNYNVQTGMSSFTFSLNKANPGDPDPDPNLIITYQPYDLFLNPEAPIVQNTYFASFPNKPWRRLEISFTRPDGATGTARAECNTSQVQPSIATQPITGGGTVIPQMGQVPTGTALRDTASMTGQTTNAGGTATFRLYQGSVCTGTPVYEVTVPVTNGVIPDSPTPGFTPANIAAAQGLYNWQVSYSGDTLNKPATSQCGLESLIVGKMQPTIKTTMRTGNTVVGQNGEIYIDQTITDQATLSNVTATAGGSITFRLYAGDCTGPVLYEETVTVTNGTAGRTQPHGPLPLGTYNWVAVYSGDAMNESATSPCGDETFNVIKRQPSVTTQPKNAANNANINDGATVAIGTSIYDTAVMNGATSDASGTVTYYLWSGSGCDTADAIWSATVNVVNGVIQNSPAVLVGGVNPFATPGTYNFQAIYSGDEKNTVSSSNCGSETVNVGKNSPSITTVMMNAADNSVIAQNAVIPVPASVYDTATLSGVSGTPTGTVTYRLYKGHLCNDLTLMYTSPALPLNADGTLPASPTVPITDGGTYNWVAQYSGDAANDGVTAGCGLEQFHAGKGSGGISTTPKKTNSNGGGASNVADEATIPVMSWVADTSTLSGFTPGRTGTITYNLYHESDCTGNPIFSSDKPVVPGAAQTQSGHFQVTLGGRYEWQAVYSGDANNNGAKSPCGAETFHVGKVSTTTVTTMKNASDGTIADNSSIVVPFQMYDTAVVNGSVVELTGTIEYRIYQNTGCTGTPTVFGPYPIVGGVIPSMPVLATLSAPTVYNWRAFYSGDTVHNASASACGGETVFGQAEPTITTGPRAGASAGSQSAIAQNAEVAIGTWVSDTSTLANASAFQSRLDNSEPRATVTYRLYAGEVCTGTPVFTSTKTVTSNSNTLPASDSVQLNFSGVYNWQATYSGNLTNLPAVSECGLERFIVAEGDPDLTTQMRHGPSSGNQGSTLVQDAFQQLPRWVSDTATLTGVPYGTTGTLTYQLFLATDSANPCNGTLVHTSVHNNVTDLSNLPASSSFQATAFGTYNWVVTFQPDATGSDPVVSGCGEETFIGVEEFQSEVTISCTYFPGNGTSTFVINASKQTSSAPDYDPNLIVKVFPFGLDNAPLPSITYNNYDSSIGPNNPNFVQQPWRRIRVEVEWPDGQRGTALAGCNDTKLTPSIATIMVDEESGVVENGTELEIGDQIGDTVQLTGATVDFGGYFEYRLYNSSDCTGDPVFTSLKTIPQPGGGMPASAIHTIAAAGDYNWRVFYSGDIYNESVTSDCNTEYFSVEKNETAITTVVKVGSTTIPQDGTVAVGASVYDTATLSGATATAGGTVTYQLFDDAECTGDAVATFVKNVTNGVIEDSDAFVAQAGKTYNWVVTYSGDANNAGSVSACGSETFVTPLLRIVKTNSSGADTISAGGTISFTIVLTNDGPGIARGASIIDPLPSNTGLVWTVDTGASSPNCEIDAGVLECDARSLGVGESITAVVTSPASSDACGPINNRANFFSLNAGNGTSNEATVEITCADVELVKTPDEGTVFPGDTAIFTIKVTNLGPGTATDVVVKETLPGGNWTVETDPDGLIPSYNGNIMTLEIGDMAEDAVVTITLSRLVTTNDCGPIRNEASVSTSNEPDDVLENNDDTALITVLCTELELVKTPDEGEVYPGETATFTIVATNLGPNMAKGVDIVETLPPGDWTVTTVPANLPQSTVGNKLTVTAGDLAAQGNVTITLSRTVSTADCGPIKNTATVSGTNEFTVTEASRPNTDTGKIEVLCTELELVKTPDEGEVYPGETATFTIVATNLGPNTAKGVDIVETLPPGDWTVTTVPANLPQSTTGNQLTVTVGDLAVNASVTITLSRTVTTADCGPIENTATVRGTNEFPVNDESRPNTDTGEIEVLCTEIRTVKSPKNGSVYAGEMMEFSIVVSNIGDNIAKGVVILDTLPTGFPASEWTITTVPSGLPVTTPLDVTVRVEAGDIPVGGSVTLILTKMSETDECGTIQNLAWATATNEIPGTRFDNLDHGQITIKCSEVSLIKSPDNARINAGEDAVFTIVAINHGAYPAVGTKITDTLPEGDWTVEVTDAPADVTVDCGTSPMSGSFTCDVEGEWQNQQPITIKVSRPTTGADCTKLVNTASVSASNEQANRTADNQDSGDITVLCSDLSVEKTPTNGVDTINAGDPISFTITVRNTGLGSALDVTLRDELPAGITWSENSHECEIVNGVLTCEFGEMYANWVKTIVVSGVTSPELCGPVVNTVTIDASNIDRGTDTQQIVDPYSSSATVTVNCATPTPTATSTPEPTATSTPEPTATSTPEPTATSTPEPTATSTPEPTATSTPEPTATSTPEPTATSTPEPTATSTPEPTATSTPEPTATSTPDPTATSTPEPTATSTPEPTATSTPEPTATSTPEPTATSTPEPTATSTPDPPPPPDPTETPTVEPTPPVPSPTPGEAPKPDPTSTPGPGPKPDPSPTPGDPISQLPDTGTGFGGSSTSALLLSLFALGALVGSGIVLANGRRKREV